MRCKIVECYNTTNSLALSNLLYVFSIQWIFFLWKCPSSSPHANKHFQSTNKLYSLINCSSVIQLLLHSRCTYNSRVVRTTKGHCWLLFALSWMLSKFGWLKEMFRCSYSWNMELDVSLVDWFVVVIFNPHTGSKKTRSFRIWGLFWPHSTIFDSVG